MSDLHEAAEGGHTAEIQEALRRGCDINMKDESFGGRLGSVDVTWSMLALLTARNGDAGASRCQFNCLN